MEGINRAHRVKCNEDSRKVYRGLLSEKRDHSNPAAELKVAGVKELGTSEEVCLQG
jgi:hypothetical protein